MRSLVLFFLFIICLSGCNSQNNDQPDLKDKEIFSNYLKEDSHEDQFYFLFNQWAIAQNKALEKNRVHQDLDILGREVLELEGQALLTGEIEDFSLRIEKQNDLRILADPIFRIDTFLNGDVLSGLFKIDTHFLFQLHEDNQQAMLKKFDSSSNNQAFQQVFSFVNPFLGKATDLGEMDFLPFVLSYEVYSSYFFTELLKGDIKEKIVFRSFIETKDGMDFYDFDIKDSFLARFKIRNTMKFSIGIDPSNTKDFVLSARNKNEKIEYRSTGNTKSVYIDEQGQGVLIEKISFFDKEQYFLKTVSKDTKKILVESVKTDTGFGMKVFSPDDISKDIITVSLKKDLDIWSGKVSFITQNLVLEVDQLKISPLETIMNAKIPNILKFSARYHKKSNDYIQIEPIEKVYTIAEMTQLFEKQKLQYEQLGDIL